MTKLEKLEKKLRKYTPEKQVRDLLKIINKPLYLTFLKHVNTEQLMQGKDIHDVLLGPPYASASYADLKLFMNPLGVVDLFLTGKFHKSIFVKASQFPITYDARDKKKDKLVRKYGDILGASEKGKEDFDQYLLPEVSEYYYDLLWI